MLLCASVYRVFTIAGNVWTMASNRTPKLVIDEGAQLRSVEEALIRRFEGQVSPDVICAEVARMRERFKSARVRTFVPVLIQNAVRDQLRRRAGREPAVELLSH